MPKELKKKKCNCMCHDFQKLPYYSDRNLAGDCVHCRKQIKEKIKDWEKDARKEFIIEWRKGTINTTSEIIDWWIKKITQQKQKLLEEIEKDLENLKEKCGNYTWINDLIEKYKQILKNK